MNQISFAAIGNNTRLVDRVVNEIQRLIVAGRLVPGMKLPPEREFAIQLNVSRTIVREAVHILVTKGLLETRHGVGTIVRQVTTDQIVEPLNFILQAEGITLDHIHQVRSILEVEIAGLAALHTSYKDIEKLRRILSKMEVGVDNPEAFSNADAEFHQVLAKNSGNPLLAVLLDSFRGLMKEVRSVVQDYPDLNKIVLPDHNLILERILEKDAEGARNAMQLHLEHARAIQEEALEQTIRDKHM